MRNFQLIFKFYKEDMNPHHLDQILISQLRLMAGIGIYPNEYLALQPIILDIQLVTNFSKAQQSDAIIDTIDYDEVIKNLQIWVAKRHFQLIETLADYLAKSLLATFLSIQTVCLQLFKYPPNLPANYVGVSIIRARM